MKRKLVIVGAGEFALIAYEYFTHDSDYEVVGFSVNAEYLSTDTLMGLPVVPLETVEKKFSPESHEAFVAITYTQLNRVRIKLYNLAKSKGYKLANYISSHAFVWRNVEIGDNVFVFENNVVQPFTKIGNNVVLWSGNHVGHQSVIKNNCFISSHVVISGYCVIGENCFLGVNATIINNISIGKDCVVGAGALVTKNVEENTVIQGLVGEPRTNARRLNRVKDEI